MLDSLLTKTKSFETDDILVSHVKETGKPVAHISPFQKTVIVAGRGSRIHDEIDLSAAFQDNMPILKRKGGGCSVVLDPGNLIVSVAFPAKGFLNIGPLFQRTCDWLIKGLKTAGISNVYQDGISDIVINNQKVGGSCFYRTKGVAYFSASILVDADLTLINKYLRMPPRQPDYRQNRSHLDFVSNLTAFSPGIRTDRLALDLSQLLDPEDLC